MAITRNDAESVLIARIGPIFTELGLNGVDVNNTDLNDPLGVAVRQTGGTVANPAAVVSSDLATVDDGKLDELLDRAELRALQTALTAARRLVSTSVGPRSEQLGQIASGLAGDIGQMEQRLKTTYGVGLASLEAGVISLRFVETNESASS
jgi:hypothetical protein